MRLAILLLLVFAAPVTAQAVPWFPPPSGFVTDAADVLAPALRDSLEARLAALDDSTTVPIAVAVLPDVGGRSVGDAAAEISTGWGIGRRGVNNGALVLLLMADRRVRIEVGYGLNRQATDSLAAAVAADMIPLFRRGTFERGIGLAGDRLARRAASVPWRVARVSVRGATEGDLGAVARLSGKARRDGIETPGGFVRLRFPSHWARVYVAAAEGEPLQLRVRLTGVDPLTANVLGLASVD